MKLKALLPMKGNSERVKNKNMKDFNGKPLYHAIMKALLNSNYVESIIVDTDSELIAQDVRKNFHDHVMVLPRPFEIYGDTVSMNEIIAYDLSQLEGEYFLQTHSTNPLLTTQTLNHAIETYFNNLKDHDCIFSVTKVQTRFYDQCAHPINHNPQELLRTQDLQPWYEENSNFYIFSKEAFHKAGNKRIGLKPKIYEMNKLEAVDIDDLEDFILAELLYKNREKQ